MSELVADMEDWSLQAIVRGSSGDFEKNIFDMNMDDQNRSFFESYQQQFDHDFLPSFPDIFEVSTGSSDELEELYKPFYYSAPSLPDNQTVVEHPEENAAVDKLKLPHDQSDQSSGTSSVASVTPSYTPKYKKRKNQHKRVVIQVSAEGLSSDMWAWRKYGQKPIKGSPYPRSYYRCSSSKGCLARKQVEESCTDPGMFIITYTAEHSHSKPTRRNSLAGTVRQKFPSPKTQSSTRAVKQEKIEKSSSRVEADVVLPTRLIKEEEIERRGGGGGESHDDNDSMMMPEFVFNDDFFSGLEDFDEFVKQVPNTPTQHTQQFPAVRSCSWF
ncbi:hypothetical protein ACS0TY_004260 [Phlomoides rotata]